MLKGKILDLVEEMIEKNTNKRITVDKIMEKTGLDKEMSEFNQVVSMFKKEGFSVVNDYYDDEDVDIECSDEIDSLAKELNESLDDEELFDDEIKNDSFQKYEENILNEAKNIDNINLKKKQKRIFDSTAGILETVRMYDLISVEEEKENAYIYQEGLTYKILLEKLDVNKEEISENLRKQYEEKIERGYEARDYLYAHNLRLVYSIAKTFSANSLEFNDLYQEGGFGLLKAIEKYDPTKQNKLATYATFWIKQHIQRAISNYDNMIKPSTHQYEDRIKVVRAVNELTIKLGRNPLPEDVSKALGMSLKRVNRILQNDYSCMSLNDIYGDEDSERLDFVPDEASGTAYEYACSLERNKRLNEAYKLLSPRDLTIFKMRYGLDGCEKMTLSKIGLLFNMSDEGIRQNVKHSEKKIRDYIEYN